jgi:hypothetical protein
MAGDRVISEANRPLVGIIYSDNDSNSIESRSLALYLAGCLISTNYARVDLVGLTSDGTPRDLQLQHKAICKEGISFLPVGKSSVRDVITVPVAVKDSSSGSANPNPNPNPNRPSSSSSSTPQIYFTHWSEVQNCQLIIVTVNFNDTEACCLKLAEVLPDRLGLGLGLPTTREIKEPKFVMTIMISLI